MGVGLSGLVEGAPTQHQTSRKTARAMHHFFQSGRVFAEIGSLLHDMDWARLPPQPEFVFMLR